MYMYIYKHNNEKINKNYFVSIWKIKISHIPDFELQYVN